MRVFDLVHLLQLFTKQHNKMSKYIGEFTYYTQYIYLFFSSPLSLGASRTCDFNFAQQVLTRVKSVESIKYVAKNE